MTGAVRAGIQLEGVHKSYSGISVLRGVDLEVSSGCLLALVGVNGAGKSTMLRILATTVLPSAGRASVDGVDVARHPAPARRRIGVCLSEERSWYSQISGRRNLEFFAALHRLRRRDRRHRVGEVLREVGLEEAADRPFATYSTGMRLRLALGRALLHGPRVLLLDEPTRSLDPAGADGFVERLLALAHRDHRCVFMITHDLREAVRADVVAILREGVIVGVAPGGGDVEALARAMA